MYFWNIPIESEGIGLILGALLYLIGPCVCREPSTILALVYYNLKSGRTPPALLFLLRNYWVTWAFLCFSINFRSISKTKCMKYIMGLFVNVIFKTFFAYFYLLFMFLDLELYWFYEIPDIQQLFLRQIVCVGSDLQLTSINMVVKAILGLAYSLSTWLN